MPIAEILWGPGLGNTLRMARETSDPMIHRVRRNGNENLLPTIAAAGDRVDGWNTGDEVSLSGEFRGIPVAPQDAEGLESSWDGPAGFASWLSHARNGNEFRFVLDRTRPDVYVNARLVSPADGGPDADIDGKRTLRFEFRARAINFDGPPPDDTPGGPPGLPTEGLIGGWIWNEAITAGGMVVRVPNILETGPALEAIGDVPEGTVENGIEFTDGVLATAPTPREDVSVNPFALDSGGATVIHIFRYVGPFPRDTVGPRSVWMLADLGPGAPLNQLAIAAWGTILSGNGIYSFATPIVTTPGYDSFGLTIWGKNGSASTHLVQNSIPMLANKVSVVRVLNILQATSQMWNPAGDTLGPVLTAPDSAGGGFRSPNRFAIPILSEIPPSTDGGPPTKVPKDMKWWGTLLYRGALSESDTAAAVSWLADRAGVI